MPHAVKLHLLNVLRQQAKTSAPLTHNTAIDNSNVAVIACGFSHQFESRLYFKTGTKTRSRYVDITAVGEHLGMAVCQSDRTAFIDRL